jgi:hypothetical protein
MDEKQKKYGTIIASWLTEFVRIRHDAKLTQYELITDFTHHHYQVIKTGWHNNHFYHRIVIHFQIKPNGKVWLLVNNTDILLFDELMERGILKTDLVIGFLPESVRQYSGYAVA